MKAFNGDNAKRKIDVCALENPLLDMLIHGSESDILNLGMTKGVMQLVEASTQSQIFSKMGNIKPHFEMGGSAANAMRGMALLGASVAFSGCVGNDEHGKLFEKRMNELGIHSQLNFVSDQGTGTCLVVVTPDGDRTLNTHLGACRSFTKSFVPDKQIVESKIFFTTGYVWDSPHQIEAVEHALQVAKQAGTKIALDVADPFVVQRSGKRLKELLETCVDIVFANADEAQMLVGSTGEKAAHILSAGKTIAVVKDGKNGAYIGHNGTMIHVPAPSVKVVDTTGAGDMFAGGFLYGIVNNTSLKRAAEIGTLLASDTITHFGVRMSTHIPDRAKTMIGS